MTRIHSINLNPCISFLFYCVITNIVQIQDTKAEKIRKQEISIN